MESNQTPYQHDAYKSRKYKRTLNEIKSILTQLGIILRLQTEHTHSVGALHINRAGEIEENLEKSAGPIDIKVSIKDISIPNAQRRIAEILNQTDVSQEDRAMYTKAVHEYISKNKHHYLRALQHPLYTQYRQEYRQGKISEHDMYLRFCLVNFLKSKHGTLSPQGEITQEGIRVIHRTLVETKLAYERTGKGIGKVFHDGDLSHILECPRPGMLQEYVDIIKYLLDKDGFNPYGEEGIEGQKRRARNKSNFLDLRYSFHHIDFLKNQEIKEFHDFCVVAMQEIVSEKQGNVLVLDRIKEEISKAKKAHGRTLEIKDDSGIRIMYYKDIQDTTIIKTDIIDILDQYFKLMLDAAKEKKYTIPKIEIVNHKEVDEKTHHEIIAHLQQCYPEILIKARENPNKKDHFLPVEKLENKIKRLEDKESSVLPQEVKTAYDLLTSAHSTRGSNGGYQDYKCVIHLDYQSHHTNKSFGQEIQFYNYKNDIGLANHEILELEKDIFAYCASNQDISLNTLRRKTAKTIKNMSTQVKRLKGEIPNFPEAARMFDIGERKISLLDLSRDTQENEQDTKSLIAYILNSFLHKRKLIHIYEDPRFPHTGDICPQDIYRKNIHLKDRFTTADVIKSAAFSKQIDAHKYISLYHEGVYSKVSVEQLIDSIAAGYKRRKKHPHQS